MGRAQRALHVNFDKLTNRDNKSQISFLFFLFFNFFSRVKNH